MTGFVSHHVSHDDIIKWKHFPHYWPFVQGFHRSPANSPHKGQWRGALMFSLIWAWMNDWVNNREAGDLRCHRTHYDVTAMSYIIADYDADFELTKDRYVIGYLSTTLETWLYSNNPQSPLIASNNGWLLSFSHLICHRFLNWCQPKEERLNWWLYYQVNTVGHSMVKYNQDNWFML